VYQEHRSGCLDVYLPVRDAARISLESCQQALIRISLNKVLNTRYHVVLPPPEQIGYLREPTELKHLWQGRRKRE